MPNSRHSAKKDVTEHRYAGQPMPSAALLPRVWHSATEHRYAGQPMPSAALLLRVWHSAKKSFAECIFLPSVGHSAKNLCRVQHSEKKVFAECPIFDTRQRILHLAKSLFPVVAFAKATNTIHD